MWLCAECDQELFPKPHGEGYVPVYALRERLEQAMTRDERIMSFLHGGVEPDLRVTLDGESIATADIDELQSGRFGWVVLYGLDGEHQCGRCGIEDTCLRVRFGHVEVELAQAVNGA